MNSTAKTPPPASKSNARILRQMQYRLEQHCGASVQPITPKESRAIILRFVEKRLRHVPPPSGAK